MRKLLTAAFLVAICTLHQANAQKATLPRKTPQKAAAMRQATAGQLSSTVAEFCLNYARYFFDLPAQYRENVYYRFQAAGLTLTPDVNLTTELAQSSTLRQVAYKSLYDFCADIQFMYRKPVDEILFGVLYDNLHMNTGPATLLAQHCQQQYQRLIPPALVPNSGRPSTESTLDNSSAKVPRMEQEASNKLATGPAPLRNHTGGGGELEMSGWRFESQPTVEALDDNEGFIRFKIEITDEGEVESVTKVASNVSAAQERLCRDKLLDANCVRTNAGKGGATGFYTFRFIVR